MPAQAFFSFDGPLAEEILLFDMSRNELLPEEPNMTSQPLVLNSAKRNRIDANLGSDLVSPAAINEAYKLVLGRPVDAGRLAHFKSVTTSFQLTFGRLLHILKDNAGFEARTEDEKARALDQIKAVSHPAEAVH